MAPSTGRSTRLSLIPLPKDSVLLPGVTLRIPLSNRPDIPVLLTSLFSRTSSRPNNPVIVGCVPLASPFLSKDGQRLLENGDREGRRSSDSVESGRATKEDLFRYGTTARIVGVQGRPNVEPFLLVEGMRRFSIRRIINDTPVFEADVTLHDEASMW